jgi:catechol 2,3-dioxygenase-like lactoylglutathione lyase family enzyme
MSVTRIHHVNFVVRDLEAAMPRFTAALGLEPFEVVDHAPRSAKVARSPVGESWLVLVEPCDPASVPGQHLAKHGEGFFLLSLATRDEFNWRAGIEDWQVSDLGEIAGAAFQFTRERLES